MRFFTSKALRRGGEKWNNALKAYRKHLAGIGPRLPSSVRSFLSIDFHDEPILNVDRPNKGTIVVRTQTYDAAFQGVSAFEFTSEEPAGDVWLYDEVDLRNDGQVELCVLLEGGELRIVFESLSVFDKLWPKWRVPPA
jgi:hypothetical protein